MRVKFAKCSRISILKLVCEPTMMRWMRLRIVGGLLSLPSLLGTAGAQQNSASAATAPAPVSYASAAELNELLEGLQQASQLAQLDLAKMRIERWRTDGNTRRQTQSNIESIQRNLQTALPEIIGQLRNSQDSLELNFKLYRNLDALCDVFGSVVESAGAFGSKEEFQSLDNDFGTIAKTRRSFADRIDSLASAKDGELVQLRIALHNAQAVAAAAPPKKLVVDDTEPVKKPVVKKKPPVKKPAPAPAPATPPPPAAKPGSAPTTPPAQQ